MLLKSYQRPGPTCWSNSKNNSHLLASASLQPNAQGNYDLSILSLDVLEKSKGLPVVGSASYKQPFRCIAWDTWGEKDGTYPYGLIFGGMEDGSITLWNVRDIISKGKTTDANSRGPAVPILEEPPIIDFPIICAEWNSLRPDMLGFGGSYVLIMNIGKGFSEDIDIFTKPSNKNPHINSYVTDVTWNKEVSNIMASASYNGLIVLWDVKTNNSIFQFKDNSPSTGNRDVRISWSKHIATQIAVTLDDDSKNYLQIWDLRNQKGPIVVIDRGHTRGINALDWCDSDPELILTAGRDKKVICWNYLREYQQIVTQVQLNEPVVDVSWSKKLPSIFSVCTESKVYIYSMNESNLFSYVPKWYKIPVGTSIGPGNQVISYNEKYGNVLTEYQVTYKNQELAPIMKSLSTLLNERNFTYYIQDKMAEGEETEFWKLAEFLLTKSSDQDIYSFLGLDKAKIIKNVEQYTGKKHSEEKSATRGTTKQGGYVKLYGTKLSSFFDSLGHGGGDKTVEDASEEYQGDNIKYEMVPRNFNWDVGKYRIIKENLLIGNYAGAIDAALKCGRNAYALVIAYSQGPEVLKNTFKTFFTETTDSFITNILRHIADRELDELIKKYQLSQWKECIAFIYSMVRDQRGPLLKQLASRLLQEQNNVYKAIVCLMLAEDFPEILTVLSKQLSSIGGRSLERKINTLKTVYKLLIVKMTTTKDVLASPILDRIFLEAAVTCFDECEALLAYNLLESTESTHYKVLYMKCLFGQSAKYLKVKPTNPFKPFNVPVMQQIKKVDISKKEGKGTHPGSNLPKELAPVGRGGQKVPQRPVPPPPQPAVYTPPNAPVNPVASVSTIGGTTGVPPPRPGGFNPNQTVVQPVTQVSHIVNRNQPPPPPPKSGPTPPPVIKKDIEPISQPIHQSQVYQQQVPSPPPPPPVKQTIQYTHEYIKQTISSQSTNRNTPPPPANRRPPPPPPPPTHTQTVEQSELPQQKSPPPPIARTMTPPPPPPPAQQTQYQAQQPTYQPTSYQQPAYQQPTQVPQNPPLTSQTSFEQKTQVPPPPARRVPPPPPPRR